MESNDACTSLYMSLYYNLYPFDGSMPNSWNDDPMLRWAYRPSRPNGQVEAPIGAFRNLRTIPRNVCLEEALAVRGRTPL